MGPIVPGPYCDDAGLRPTPTTRQRRETILTDAGWTKNGDGMWANPDGEVPEVRWMVNTGNTRRESTQAYLIPLLAEAGFDVVADNCEALPACSRPACRPSTTTWPCTSARHRRTRRT